MCGKSHLHPNIYSPWVAVISASTTDLHKALTISSLKKKKKLLNSTCWFRQKGNSLQLVFFSTLSIHERDWLNNWYVYALPTASWLTKIKYYKISSVIKCRKDMRTSWSSWKSYSAMQHYQKVRQNISGR